MVGRLPLALILVFVESQSGSPRCLVQEPRCGARCAGPERGVEGAQFCRLGKVERQLYVYAGDPPKVSTANNQNI